MALYYRFLNTHNIKYDLRHIIEQVNRMRFDDEDYQEEEDNGDEEE